MVLIITEPGASCGRLKLGSTLCSTIFQRFILTNEDGCQNVITMFHVSMHRAELYIIYKVLRILQTLLSESIVQIALLQFNFDSYTLYNVSVNREWYRSVFLH